LLLKKLSQILHDFDRSADLSGQMISIL